MSKSPEEYNRIMVKFLPELASKYAKYPMKYDTWLTPNQKGPKGEPCFIESPDVGVKMDYVFGKGPNGPAYYHLLTKTAYVNLYSRISSSNPVACCACTKASMKEVDEWDDVKRIMYNRYMAKKPDDQQGAKDALAAAQGTAQAWHNGLQNEQQALNFVQTATAF
jgi:hypothetical protein